MIRMRNTCSKALLAMLTLCLCIVVGGMAYASVWHGGKQLCNTKFGLNPTLSIKQRVNPIDVEVPEWKVVPAVAEVSVSDDELLVMAKIIMAEAGGEPYDAKIAVGNVVVHRINSESFPDTLMDVLTQRNQFTPVQNGTWNRYTPTQECMDAAYDVLVNGVVLYDGIMWFEACAQPNPWHINNLEYVVTIGRTRFYR